MKRSENVPAGDEGAATVAIYTAGTCFLILLAQCGHPEGKINLFFEKSFFSIFCPRLLKMFVFGLKKPTFSAKSDIWCPNFFIHKTFW